MLPNEAILEYQAIYQKTYGVRLSLEQAAEYATKLFNFVELVATQSEDKQ